MEAARGGYDSAKTKSSDMLNEAQDKASAIWNEITKENPEQEVPNVS